MTTPSVIADDLTGACDVGAELATAGFIVRVMVDCADQLEAPRDAPGVVRVLNTQSRGLGTRDAHDRVSRAVRRRPAAVLLKKIDTALRGHLGTELDAALDGIGARLAFILPAIPAAGRVTREGCQWFAGLPLASTEFANDPEGAGGESSIAAVLARESGRRAGVIGRSVVTAGELAERARTFAREGVAFVVVDAESDADLATAVASILALEPPLCLAGSTALAWALARHLAERGDCSAPGTGIRPGARPCATPRGPALIVCGSLHSTAREQIAAVLKAGLAVRVAAPASDACGGVSAAALAARVALGAGRHVVVSAVAPAAPPDLAARRATESTLAELTREIIAESGPAATLVLIGGETSYAVLRRLGTTELAVRGCFAPLIAVGEILDGTAAGAELVTKGGSGGGVDTLVALLTSTAAGGTPAAQSVAG